MYTKEQLKSIIDMRLKETGKTLDNKSYLNLLEKINNMSMEELASIGIATVHDEVCGVPLK